MQEEYVLDDVERIIENKLNKKVSRQTIINYIKTENFYNQGLAYKKPNGFEIDGKQGKIWMITYEGVKHILEHFSEKKEERLRITKDGSYQLSVPADLVEKNEIKTKDELTSVVIDLLEGRYDKTFKIKKEKEDILKQINDLQARYNELESIG